MTSIIQKTLHEIPEYASPTAKLVGELYSTLQTDVTQGKWKELTAENISLDFNPNIGSVCLEIKFKDKNSHNHSISLGVFPWNWCEVNCDYLDKASIRYIFEGVFETNSLTIQSFAEYLKFCLWEDGLKPELTNCDKGFTVDIATPLDYDALYHTLYSIIDKLDREIKPIEWFCSKDDFWPVRKQHKQVSSIYSMLKEEADKGRWKDVSRNNFILEYNRDWTGIFLRYRAENESYTMWFRISVGTNYPNYHRDIQCDYYFSTSGEFDDNLSECYRAINKEFIEAAHQLLEVPFSYNAELSSLSKYGEIIITCRQADGFQKFCLMLDIMLPLIRQFKTIKPLYGSVALNKKKLLEKLLSSPLEISQELEPYSPFAKGHFMTEQELNDKYYGL